MAEISFSLNMAAGACTPGLEQALELFEPGRAYTIQEIVEAGLDPQNLLWLLITRSSRDTRVLSILQTWSRQCAVEVGLPSSRPATGEACALAVRDAMRAWIKQNRQASGVREWAHAILIQILQAEGA